MNDSTNQPADDAREAALDRLTDRVLAEAIGGETPPDLSETILRHATDRQVDVDWEPDKGRAMQTRRAWAVLLATAACATMAVYLGNSKVVVEANIAKATKESATGTQFAFQNNKVATISESTESVVTAQPSSSDRSLDLSSASVPVDDRVREGLMRSDTITSDRGLDTEAEVAAPATAGTLLAVSEGDSAAKTASAPASPRFRTESFHSLAERGKSRLGRGAAQAPQAAPATPGPSPYYLTDDVDYFAPSAGEPSRRQTFGVDAIEVDGGVPTRPRFAWGERYESPHDDRHRQQPYFERPSGDKYDALPENEFTKPLGGDALSTFSVDVDTASYTNARQFLLDMRRLPPAASIRVEEFVNYFDYGYAGPDPESETPFAASMEVAPCPWKPAHRLVRIGVKGREVDAERRPLTNLVFLVDVSGSMNNPNKLPLVVEGLKALTARLGENDRVAIVVYAGSEGVVLPSTSGDQKQAILSSLDRLRAGGSTAGGAGLKLAYEIAERHRIEGGVNRVVLCTDGDFNVGLTGTEELTKLVETRAKETGVFLTVLGFGRGNLNDAMLESISGRGNGHYAYVDSEKEARRVLSRDLSGTLVTIAKDVKLQVEFNPARVAAYRLIGYENRVLAAKDFNDDKKDAGEIGAGHTVTALYEVVPVGVEKPSPPVDGLKYQQKRADGRGQRAEEEPAADSGQPTADSDELLTLKIRYKEPDEDVSTKLEFPLEDGGQDLAAASGDFRWAAAVAEFAMLLRESRHAGDATFDNVLDLARGAVGDDPQGYRAELLDLVRKAKEVGGR